MPLVYMCFAVPIPPSFLLLSFWAIRSLAFHPLVHLAAAHKSPAKRRPDKGLCRIGPCPEITCLVLRHVRDDAIIKRKPFEAINMNQSLRNNL
ncbi:hypothetical protein V8C34DRAFT_268214 [Trichoderma compactum]